MKIMGPAEAIDVKQPGITIEKTRRGFKANVSSDVTGSIDAAASGNAATGDFNGHLSANLSANASSVTEAQVAKINAMAPLFDHYANAKLEAYKELQITHRAYAAVIENITANLAAGLLVPRPGPSDNATMPGMPAALDGLIQILRGLPPATQAQMIDAAPLPPEQKAILKQLLGLLPSAPVGMNPAKMERTLTGMGVNPTDLFLMHLARTHPSDRGKEVEVIIQAVHNMNDADEDIEDLVHSMDERGITPPPLPSPIEPNPKNRNQD